MYIPQLVDTQAWAANDQLRFDLSNLQLELNGSPLHLVEWIVVITAAIDNTLGAAFDAYEVARLLNMGQFTPNQPCDGSWVSGHAMQSLDWALTGRRGWEDAQIGVASVDRRIALRLPFHGSLLGAKSMKYKDLISPVWRWNNGQVVMTCSAADPFSDANATITSGSYKLIAVTEPFPTEYVEGPAVVYGETVDDTGGSTMLYPSEGRTMYMGLHPLDRDTSVYPTYTYKDLCLLSGLDPITVGSVWNAMCCLGDGGDNALNVNNPEFLPIVFSRAEERCPQWTLPVLPQGNRTITLTNTTASEHRLCWAQLRGADLAHNALANKLGTEVPPTEVDLDKAEDSGDVIKNMNIARTLPKQFPKYPASQIEQQQPSANDVVLVSK